MDKTPEELTVTKEEMAGMTPAEARELLEWIGNETVPMLLTTFFHRSKMRKGQRDYMRPHLTRLIREAEDAAYERGKQAANRICKLKHGDSEE